MHDLERSNVNKNLMGKDNNSLLGWFAYIYISNLDEEAGLHTAVLHTCQMTMASQHFHRDASSYQMDTSCLGFQHPDTLLVEASYAAVLDDHLDSKYSHV